MALDQGVQAIPPYPLHRSQAVQQEGGAPGDVAEEDRAGHEVILGLPGDTASAAAVKLGAKATAMPKRQ